MNLMQAHEVRYVVGLLMATGASVGLLLAESAVNYELTQGYLIWNLFLAWLPLVAAFWLGYVLRTKLWSSWTALLLTLAWLVLIPNSFYIISDLIHLAELSPDETLFGAVTTTAFMVTGGWLGFTSLFLVHRELLKRTSSRAAAVLIGLVLLLTSFAIYVGRDLRWNSWDVLFSPFGLMFDVSERLLHPSQYPQVAAVVLPFFVLLASVYFVVWRTIEAVRGVQN